VPEEFRVVDDSAEELILRLGPHGLDGEAPELWAFLSSEIGSGRHVVVSLEAADASVVTLEGVGILVRLLIMAKGAGGDLRIESPHPALERKLTQVGVLSLFVRA
jgi:anti-anti-sigma regulatory factor